MPDALDELARSRPSGERARLTELTRAIIADCGGDPTAAVGVMVRINHALMCELQALAGQALTGKEPRERALAPRH